MNTIIEIITLIASAAMPLYILISNHEAKKRKAAEDAADAAREEEAKYSLFVETLNWL